jgi:[CysO sulfur-carrier protein]-S-L-cysteine hydrolase
MVSNIILTSQQHSNLVSLAKNSLPRESCALLAGEKYDNEIYIEELIPMKNSDSSAFTFRIDGQELMSVYQSVELRGIHVVGIFHSHPAAPIPSSRDKEFMIINPVVWLIYSTVTNECKAYVYEEDEKIKEVHIRLRVQS